MRTTRLVICLMVLLATTGSLLAQAGATGTILGTVTDSTGAVLPDAAVQIKNMATGVTANTVTSSSGDFQAPSLISGPYSVSAEAKGFKKSVANGLSLAVDQKLRVNLTLMPGEVTSIVEVTTQAVALDTDTAGLASLVSQQQVENLPLNGRNFMQLLLVTPGAVTVGGEQGTMRQGVGNAVSVNGGRPEGNNYTLDGLSNTDLSLVTPAVILSQDAIQEFKVESGTYSAEYGFSASQVNIVSKGGGNQLHGSIFESNRNDAYDAKPFPTATDYQSNVATSKAVLRQNQFGFVADGPIYIPKIYDGRNKTFFMANYEGWRITNGSSAKYQVPNPAVLTGDFSNETYSAVAGNALLPGGFLPAPGTPACTAAKALGSINCMPEDPTTGLAFPGNIIPKSKMTNNLWTVASTNGYFATPTVSGAAEGVNNYIKNIGLPLRSNQQTYRLDQVLGKFGSIFGRYTYSTFSNSSQNTATFGPGTEIVQETAKSWTVSHTISLGKSSTNNFRFGYLDANAPQGAAAPSASAVSTLNMAGTFTKFGPLQQTSPSLVMTGYSRVGGPINSYTGSDAPTWEFADSFSIIRGKHTINAGVDYRRWRLIRNLDDDFYGDWTFSANLISQKNYSPNCIAVGTICGTGNALGDLMLGYYAGANSFVPGPLGPTDQAGNPQTHIFSYFAPYVEDDWKVNQRLTLDIGLRWDYRPAAYEQKDHFFWLDTQNTNGGGLCFADKTLLTNGVAPAGNQYLRYCGSNVPHPGSKTPFAPRFGMTYRLNDKTVLRGGYGIFFDSSEGREIDNSGDIYPYATRISANPTANVTPAFPTFGNQLFPSYPSLTAFAANNFGFIAVIESENPLNPYVQSWTGSFQRELVHNTTFEVNYIGTHSVHLLNRRNIGQANAIDPANLSICQANPADTTHNCPSSSRLPYKNFAAGFLDSDFHGYAHYNGMNVRLDRRANNLAATVIYTLAQSKDDKSAAAGGGAAAGTGWQGFMDNHHPELDYGLSDFSVQNRVVATAIYALPFGIGQKMLGGINRAADLAIGGWQVTGIVTLQSGFPFAMGANDLNNLNGSAFGTNVDQRASYTPGCNLKANLTAPFQRLNMACFTQPAAGTYGNSVRNFLTQPGLSNFDLGFGKTFTIAERLKFEFNAQAFNAFNHHQYAANVGGLATSGSNSGSAIDNNMNDALAGKITGSVFPSRELQLNGKITF
jgi:hypothetical protein